MEIYCDNVRPWNLIQDKKSYNKSLATANGLVHSFPSLISSYYKIITIYILLHLANVFVWEIRFCINLKNNTFFKAKVWQNALHKISFNICMSLERSETFLKVLVLQKNVEMRKLSQKEKINSCKVQLSLTSFYHCQFQLSTLQRGKKLIIEQLFIYFCVFFSSLWIQLFFGQIFIDYILFIPKVFLSMWKWHIILQWIGIN